MCQAYEGERNFLVHQEIEEIRDTWAKHQSGEIVLTNEQIKELCVRKMMLDEM